MGRLEGSVAIVTGAARGIGAAIAAALARNGCKVVVSDVADCDGAVRAIEDAGGSALAVQADVTNPDDLARLVEATTSRYGKLNVLVNNAGLFTTLTFRSVLEIDEKEWDEVMRVNVRGAFSCVKAALPALRKAGGGSIVNVASSTAFSGMPRMLHYVASKGAMIAMTKALARELGEDLIRVNAIALGLTLSPRLLESTEFDHRRAVNLATRSLKRDQLVDDCTGTVVHLASAESAFITGQTIVIDGGAVLQ